MLSEHGNILFALDLHRWNDNVQESTLPSDNRKKIGMKCSACGIWRLGPFAEHGNYYYFIYEHQIGIVSEFVPPCKNLPAPTDGIIDTINVCAKCSHKIESLQDGCTSKCNAGFHAIKFCRSLKPRW